MELKEKHRIEQEELRSILQTVMKAARLERYIPDAYVHITNLDGDSWAEIKFLHFLRKYAIRLSPVLSPDMRIIAIVHEVAHLKLKTDHENVLLRFMQFLFRLTFSFIKMDGRRISFGEEFFIEAFVAARIIAKTHPKLMPLQKKSIRGLVAKYAPTWLHKPLWKIGDLLLLLNKAKVAFFISVKNETIYAKRNPGTN